MENKINRNLINFDNSKPVLTAVHLKTPGLKKQWYLPAHPVVVGRSSRNDYKNTRDDKFYIDFSRSLSRNHFVVENKDGKIFVKKCDLASSPVFFRGEAVEEIEPGPGEVFTAGDIKFYIEFIENVPPEQEPHTHFTLNPAVLEEARERNARRCLDAVMLVQQVIGENLSSTELLKKCLSIIRQVLSMREEIMALKITPASGGPGASRGIEVFESAVVCVENSCAEPSRKLIRKSLETGKPEVYQWKDQHKSADFTVVEGVRWACSCPVEAGVSDGGMFVFYVMGFDPEPDSDKISVIHLISEVASQYLKAKNAIRLNYQVGHFFSPPVREILFSSRGGELLQPRLTPVVTMFFDLRGFSKASEKAGFGKTAGGSDSINVKEYYKNLSDVLTKATAIVFKYSGTILDYQGDAIIACWGAPQDLENKARLAATAAIEIVETVSALDLPFGKITRTGKLMKCGVGMSFGEAMEGCLNAGEQVKYTLIGPVMNVASRLEGITKYIGLPILVTGEFIDELQRESGRGSSGGPAHPISYRRIGKVMPAGMNQPVNLYEIVVNKESGGSGADNREIEIYHQAVELFEMKEFEQSANILGQLPTNDAAAHFLREWIGGNTVNVNDQSFDGVIRFEVK